MNYSYNETSDTHLSNWKRFLGEEEKLSFEAELESGDWYSVIQDKNNAIVLFEILENKRDDCAKSLRITFHPHFFKNIDNIVEIILFIYKSMLEICTNKSIFKLKLHLKNKVIKDIFDLIVDYEINNKGEIKNCKKYGNWIDFEIKT